MKKIFAALAAAAVAVSMLAFTGCEHTEYDGSIPGDYKQKSDEEITEIIGNIVADNSFGNSNSDVAFGMGLNANLSGNVAMSGTTVASGSINMDYKATDNAGMGTASVDFSYSDKSSSFSGNFYNDKQYVYASAKADGQTMNFSLDVDKLMEAYGSGIGNGSMFPALPFAANDTDGDTDDVTESVGMSWFGYIFTAIEKYDVSVGVDDSDGVKIKISLSEETIWGLLTDFGGEKLPEESVEQLQKIVTVNKFVFDVYLAIDSEGNFSQASIVTDINVSMPLFLGAGSPAAVASPAPTAAVTMPEITVSIKGYVEAYGYNGTVEIPDYVKDYVDMTDEVIEEIKGEWQEL